MYLFPFHLQQKNRAEKKHLQKYFPRQDQNVKLAIHGGAECKSPARMTSWRVD